MKKQILLTATLAGVAEVVMAQSADDSLRMEQLQEVVIRSVRAQQEAPFAKTTLNRKALADFAGTGRELPMLLQQTPGVTAWSENGLGTGTTYMRIRGAAGSRINVTLDGVTLNSPEDQTVFWANMNSYAALMGSVQIQRGVGTSTNGDGAFGGTISLSTKTPNLKPTLEVSANYGSYNTYNVGGSFSTGLLWKRLVIDGAYHHTGTDGYVHGTDGNSGSYYGGLTWNMNDHLQLRYKNIGNYEMTGQAWNGVTAGNDDLSLMDGTYGEQTGINTYKDMYDRGLGQYNSLYEQLLTDDNGNFVKDADGNYKTLRYQMADGSHWPRTTDNFWQNHNLLSLAFSKGPLSTTGTLHYTYGYGYYEEFRSQNKLAKFGLTYTDDEGNALKRTDFVRRKGLEQHSFGLLWNLSYRQDRWDVTGGVSVQQLEGKHFGYINYVAHEGLRRKLLEHGNYTYYDSDASKSDAMAYIRAQYAVLPQLDIFADMQYRHVDYRTHGINDKFYEGTNGYYNQRLNIEQKYDFFNPKAGLTFHIGGHRAFASVAVSHREPERNNFTDNGSYPAPKAEKLTDWEAGYSYTAPKWNVSAGLYYMDYLNQFVQTGQQSDIGENLTTNIRDSYRMGIELAAAADIAPWLNIAANASLSRNKLKDFDEYVEDWDDWEGNADARSLGCDGNGDGMRVLHYDDRTLSFSPSVIANGFVNLHWRGLAATWHTGYVSRQYLDNTQNNDRSLPAYTVSNVRLSYDWLPEKRFIGIRELVLNLNINNVFNSRYASNGWVYSAIYGSGGHANDNRYRQIGFMPMAGITLMGGVTLKF
ncbi:MAG: TonB-dependent receptor [Prevotella sp.]|nr:TonB-dependent receptor [Prevotella sp.]